MPFCFCWQYRYSVVKVLYLNNSALTDITWPVKKLPAETKEGIVLLL
jgi:hypothetical protein